jgi:large subunit ribosomal protein L17
MRHGKKFNHLGRQKAHREAMLSNMACSLIEHKRINTTVAKAKALRKYVEPLITKSKDDSTHSRRVVFSYLNNKEAVTELFRDVAPKIADRPGGYLRILKTGRRIGDSAEMCMVELVDFNELLLDAGKAKAKKSRRGGKKKADGAAAPVGAAPVADVAEEVTETPEAVVEATPVAEVAEEVKAEEPAAEAPKAEESSEEKTDEEANKKEE